MEDCKVARKHVREHVQNIREAYNEWGKHHWSSVVCAASELYTEKNKNLLRYWWNKRHKSSFESNNK